MAEDVDPKERIESLLAEREAIALRPAAAKRQAQIDDQLKELGYEGDLPAEVETADAPPKRRSRARAAEAAE